MDMLWRDIIVTFIQMNWIGFSCMLRKNILAIWSVTFLITLL